VFGAIDTTRGYVMQQGSKERHTASVKPRNPIRAWLHTCRKFCVGMACSLLQQVWHPEQPWERQGRVSKRKVTRALCVLHPPRRENYAYLARQSISTRRYMGR